MRRVETAGQRVRLHDAERADRVARNVGRRCARKRRALRQRPAPEQRRRAQHARDEILRLHLQHASQRVDRSIEVASIESDERMVCAQHRIERIELAGDGELLLRFAEATGEQQRPRVVVMDVGVARRVADRFERRTLGAREVPIVRERERRRRRMRTPSSGSSSSARATAVARRMRRCPDPARPPSRTGRCRLSPSPPTPARKQDRASSARSNSAAASRYDVARMPAEQVTAALVAIARLRIVGHALRGTRQRHGARSAMRARERPRERARARRDGSRRLASASKACDHRWMPVAPSMSCATTRRPPARDWTLPSSSVRTPTSRAISRTSTWRPLKLNDVVRATTFRRGSWTSASIVSSVSASHHASIAASPERLTNGRTSSDGKPVDAGLRPQLERRHVAARVEVDRQRAIRAFALVEARELLAQPPRLDAHRRVLLRIEARRDRGRTPRRRAPIP